MITMFPSTPSTDLPVHIWPQIVLEDANSVSNTPGFRHFALNTADPGGPSQGTQMDKAKGDDPVRSLEQGLDGDAGIGPTVSLAAMAFVDRVQHPLDRSHLPQAESGHEALDGVSSETSMDQVPSLSVLSDKTLELATFETVLIASSAETGGMALSNREGSADFMPVSAMQKQPPMLRSPVWSRADLVEPHTSSGVLAENAPRDVPRPAEKPMDSVSKTLSEVLPMPVPKNATHLSHNAVFPDAAIYKAMPNATANTVPVPTRPPDSVGAEQYVPLEHSSAQYVSNIAENGQSDRKNPVQLLPASHEMSATGHESRADRPAEPVMPRNLSFAVTNDSSSQFLPNPSHSQTSPPPLAYPASDTNRMSGNPQPEAEQRPSTGEPALSSHTVKNVAEMMVLPPLALSDQITLGRLEPLADGPLPQRQTEAVPSRILPLSLPAEILRLAQTASDGPVTLTLRPEDLGTLRFQVTLTEQGLHIHLTVDQPTTLDLLRRQGDQLLAELRQSGFAGASLSFSGNGSQDAASQQSNAPKGFTSADALSIPQIVPHLRPAIPSGALDLRL